MIDRWTRGKKINKSKHIVLNVWKICNGFAWEYEKVSWLKVENQINVLFHGFHNQFTEKLMFLSDYPV